MKWLRRGGQQMGNTRQSLGLEERIDLEELTKIDTRKPEITEDQKKDLYQGGEKLGFGSRMPTKRRGRKKSPYTIAKGVKIREGMPELFIELAEHLGLQDNQTFERAILALIEKEGTDALLQRYRNITE